MICGFCHKEIDEIVGVPEGQASCGQCIGGCRKIHCPHCGYTNPVPGKFLGRFLQRKEKDR